MKRKIVTKDQKLKMSKKKKKLIIIISSDIVNMYFSTTCDVNYLNNIHEKVFHGPEDRQTAALRATPSAVQ